MPSTPLILVGGTPVPVEAPPELTPHLEINQEEIGALSGISRQHANQRLRRLEQQGLPQLEYAV